MAVPEGLKQKESPAGGTGAKWKGENIQMCKVSIYIHSAPQTPADKYNYSLSHLQILDEYGDFTGITQKKQNYYCQQVLYMLFLV